MAPPTFPILYWRDTNTKTSDVSFDTIEELLAAKPQQCLVFDSEAKQLEHLLKSGDDPVTNEPGLNPDGTLTVNKQQGRSPVPTLTLEGNVNVSEIAWRQQVEGFSRKSQVEHSFHEYGIIGFYHPDLDDFSLDPTDTIGYTMALPVFEYFSPAGIVHFRFSLSLGVKSLS